MGIESFGLSKNKEREMKTQIETAIETAKYDGVKLTALGYGDAGEVVELIAAEVVELAACVGGTVEEIESCRID
jgi:hypothetical protein